MNEIAFPVFASELSHQIVVKRGRSSCPFATEKKILDRIASENLTLKYLGYAEPFKGNFTKIAFECLECGDIWKTSTVNNFVNIKTKCPCHRKRSSIEGIKRKARESEKKRLPNVPTFYIMKFREPINGQGICKVGVSKNPNQRKRRLKCINQRPLDIIFTVRFENGYGATGLEDFIKKEMNSGVVGSDVLKDGFSETIIYTPENIKKVKSLVNEYRGRFYHS